MSFWQILASSSNKTPCQLQVCTTDAGISWSAKGFSYSTCAWNSEPLFIKQLESKAEPLKRSHIQFVTEFDISIRVKERVYSRRKGFTMIFTLRRCWAVTTLRKGTHRYLQYSTVCFPQYGQEIASSHPI